MDITASMVKELRDKTGAGMMDCKRALQETNGEMDKAIDWLREKGIAKAQKKASRIAAEGVVEIVGKGDKALIFEVNCETDFVAKNERFTSFVTKAAQIILNSNAESAEAALLLLVEDKTLGNLMLETVAGIGENLSLRNVLVFHKSATQNFGLYNHMNGKIVALAITNGGTPEVAKDIAMHVCASSPRYLNQSEIAEDVIRHEREVLTKEALNENAEAVKPKPEAIVVKMVEGRLNKNLKEICLVNQPFIKNPDQTVEEYVKSHGASIASFTRLVAGEGIEKKEVNFADEVRAAVK